MWKVKFNPKSISEMEEALAYFQNLSPSTANRFFLEIKKAASTLSKNPNYQVRYKNVRCFPLKRFPFMIHFELEENEKLVKILGCIHTSLNPDKSWR
jgi:hypothetical protein